MLQLKRQETDAKKLNINITLEEESVSPRLAPKSIDYLQHYSDFEKFRGINFRG